MEGGRASFVLHTDIMSLITATVEAVFFLKGTMESLSAKISLKVSLTNTDPMVREEMLLEMQMLPAR